MTPEQQERAEALLRAGLDDVSICLQALAATQPALALEAYCALAEAAYPYLKGDRRAGSVLMRARAAEALLRSD
jgi:hypothetical protein